MTRFHFLARVLLLAVLAGMIGCDEPQGQAADAGDPAPKLELLPPLTEGVRIVLEAEDGAFEPEMVVEGFRPYRHPSFGVQQASGGKCISIPDKVNPKDAKEDELKGKVTLRFSVPKDGDYYIYPRAWWLDQCGDSFGMLIDGRNPTKPPQSRESRKPMMVTGTTHKVWKWVKFPSSDVRSTAPRAFRLSKGGHTITFTNREDGAKLDQVYITDDPEDEPVGIRKKTD